jgi:hypothetical protein
MSDKKSKQRIRLENTIKYFLDNWTIISLIISGIIVLVMSIIGTFFPTVSINEKFYSTFIYIAGSSLVLTLLEIRSLMKAKTFSNYYDGMNSAQDDIFKKLSKRMKMRKKDPVVLRIYGMRLSGVSVLLQSFINHPMRHSLGSRKLIVYVYFCDPEFMVNIKLGNEELQTKIRNMFKIQSKRLEANIEELKRASNNHPVINNIYFRKYSSLPSFWAYEIDREDVFWGYFTWDEDATNWIGPENQCCYFNKYNQPINGLTDWIHNQFDGLEALSLPYDGET